MGWRSLWSCLFVGCKAWGPLSSSSHQTVQNTAVGLIPALGKCGSGGVSAAPPLGIGSSGKGEACCASAGEHITWHRPEQHLYKIDKCSEPRSVTCLRPTGTVQFALVKLSLYFPQNRVFASSLPTWKGSWPVQNPEKWPMLSGRALAGTVLLIYTNSRVFFHPFSLLIQK